MFLPSDLYFHSSREMWTLFFVALLGAGVEAATKTFTWNMSYVTASPNGVSRSVIGVNGHFPPPTIYVSKNDQVVIQVTNSLNDGEFIALHTHGIFQNGSNYYDGVDQVTQWYTSCKTSLTIVGSLLAAGLSTTSPSENRQEHTGFILM
jgi:FtsP/CotA-like multicopper oxidase with cupredoxin domain